MASGTVPAHLQRVVPEGAVVKKLALDEQQHRRAEDGEARQVLDRAHDVRLEVVRARALQRVDVDVDAGLVLRGVQNNELV